MPPPCNAYEFCHINYASAFFLTALLGLAAAAVAEAPAGFLEAALLILALIALLFLETPNEPFQRLPFFDFLSPFPIE
jgi:hypothetical protein